MRFFCSTGAKKFLLLCQTIADRHVCEATHAETLEACRQVKVKEQLQDRMRVFNETLKPVNVLMLTEKTRLNALNPDLKQDSGALLCKLNLIILF